MNQPSPIPNNRVTVVDIVIDDIIKRKQDGIDTYGVPLQPFNGRNSLEDLYDEIVDSAIYLRQKLIEDGEIRLLIHMLIECKKHGDLNGILLYVDKLEALGLSK